MYNYTKKCALTAEYHFKAFMRGLTFCIQHIYNKF